jgi:hypothetical protein
MPEVSRFFGIVVAIYFNDHEPAHFHAKYAEHRARILIAAGEVIGGSLPRRVLSLVDEWRVLHVVELEQVWARIHAREPFERIEPLE